MRKLLRLAPCVLFVVLAAQGACRDWRTNDEGPFLHFGLLHLGASDVKRNQFFNSKLPVTALHAIPARLLEPIKGPAFHRVEGHVVTEHWALAWGRAVGILLGAILVWTIGGAAESLAGPRAGAAASLLAALEPNLLAHFHLVTADGGATLAALLLALATLRQARTPSVSNALLLGVTFGLVLLCKFMLVIWIALALVAVLSRKALSGPAAAAALFALLLVVNAGFFFRGFPGTLPEHPKSHKVSLAQVVLDGAPLPLPQNYLDGFDWTAGDEEQGRGFGNLYLLGEAQTNRRGWWWYYAVNFALKLPLPILALALLGAAWNRGRDFWTLRILAIGWFLFLSFANRAQIGIRHALPIVPIIIIEAAAAYARLERTRPWLARALVVWLGASVLSFAPDFIPYTNELVLDRKLAYRIFADSNLDWGQAEVDANNYIRAHRDVVWSPEEPVKGKTVMVNVNALVGVTEPPEKFAWLRELTPREHLRHAFLIFEVP